MTDDIVTRLRNWDTSINEMLEAADEIERLREENRELLEIAKNFFSHGRCDVYEQEWGMCLHANCEWHNTEHDWETYCMRRGL